MMDTSPTILIVDDNEGFRRIYLEYLKSLGVCRLLEAADGLQAWDLLQREKVDVILADIMMPKMDGMALLKKIRETPAVSDVYLIFATASHSLTSREQGLKLGADDFLEKPIIKHDLLTRIETGLRTVAKRRQQKKVGPAIRG